MANTVTRDPHLLARNLKLNDHYISNDGDDEGISISDAGLVGIGNPAPGSSLEVSKVTGDTTLELSSWSALNSHSGALIFQKSSIATVNTFGDGSGTAAGEALGRIEAWGATQDSTAADDVAKLSSYISFSNDAASRHGTVPGKIIFATAPDSDNYMPVTRMTLDDGGDLTLNNKLYLYDAGGEYLQSDGTDLTIASGRNITFDTGGNTIIDLDVDSTVGGSRYGLLIDIDRVGDVSLGTDITYGMRITSSVTGASGGTIKNYGALIQTASDDAGSGTSETLGLAVDVSNSANSDSNICATFEGGNVGIGTTSPISSLEIQDGINVTGAVLTLGTKETTVVANDVLGRINFYAPLDTGTDSDEIGASISAVAQDTFSDSVNSTALYFQTGKSEAATGTTASMVIDEDGKVGLGTIAPAKALHVVNSALVKGRATFTLTGSIDVTGTNVNVPGTGTKYLTELSIGDDIVVSGETRTIASITNDTTATVTVAWGSDLSNDASPDCNPAAFTVIRDTGTAGMTLNDSGNLGIGVSSPATSLSVDGAITIKEQASAPTHLEAHGILWVDDSNPTNLYFTDDDDNDVQITSSGLVHTSSGVAADNINTGDAEVSLDTNTGDVIIATGDVAGDIIFKGTASGTDEFCTFKTNEGSGNGIMGYDGSNHPASEILAPSNQRLRLRTQGQQQPLQLFSGQNVQIGCFNQDFDSDTSGGTIQKWAGTDPFTASVGVNHTSGMYGGNIRNIQHSEGGKVVIGMRVRHGAYGSSLPVQAFGGDLAHVVAIVSSTIFTIDVDPLDTGTFQWEFMTGLYYYPTAYWGTSSGTWTNTEGWLHDGIPQELDQDHDDIPAQVRGSGPNGGRASIMVSVESNQPKVYPIPVNSGTGFQSVFTDASCNYKHDTGINASDGSSGDSDLEDKSTITHNDDDGAIKLFMSVHGTGIPVGAYVGEVDGTSANAWFRIHKGGGTGAVSALARVAVTTSATPGTLTFRERVVFKDPSADAWIAAEVEETGDGYIQFGTHHESGLGKGNLIAMGYMDGNESADWNFTARRKISMKSDNYYHNVIQLDADEIYLGGAHHTTVTGQNYTEVHISEQLWIDNATCNIPRIRLYYSNDDSAKYLHFGAGNSGKTLLGGFLLKTSNTSGETLITTDNVGGSENTSHITIKPEGNLNLIPNGTDSFGSVIVDKDVTETDAGTYTALSVDFDKDGSSSTNNTLNGILIDMDNITATSGTNTMYGIYCTPTLTHAADAGTPIVIGAYLKATGAANGTSTSIGLRIDQTVMADTSLGLQIRSATDTADYFSISTTTSGATTMKTVDGGAAVGHLTIVADGHVEFDGCAVGFDLETPTYNASDTDVSFITGNKQFVTFGAGNITDLNLIFPETSGNFVLLLKQDGTGSRTVTNYKAWDLVNSDAADGSATVKFAGLADGAGPTLTTDANHVDIISIFWDADNQIAYGVASLDFRF